MLDDRRTRGAGRRARMAARVALVVGAAVAAVACATTVPPREPAPPERRAEEAPVAAPAPVVRHVVTPGQTLWRIARAYGIPVDELIRANDIADPTNVAVGTELIIPGAAAPVEVPPFPLPVAPGTPPPVPATVGGWLWPVVGTLSSGFGAPRSHHHHSGIDIRAGAGTPVRASRAGVVVFSGSRRGYGRMIVLDHGDGVRTLYAHADRLLVEEGAEVERGQPIATVGRTGNATGTHCHFEILENGTPVDPVAFLSNPHEATR